MNSIQVGDILMVEKGCSARNVAKNAYVIVTAVEPLGPEYSHSVRVQILFRNGPLRRQSWYARHINRLSDVVINLNDGNPLHTIKLRRR